MNGHIDSFYSASANPSAEHACLEQTVRADVCVIGGGYTGLSTALHLAEKGMQVVLLEAKKVGWGASGRNGGHVGAGQRQGQAELEKMVGKEAAHKLWLYSIEAVNTVEALIKKHHIVCDLKRGILHAASKAGHCQDYIEDTRLLQNDYGYNKVRYVDRDEVSAMVGSDAFYGGQLDEGSLHLHPLNFALGLAKAATDAGVKIYENSAVLDYSAQSPSVVRTEKGSVTADHVVLACNGYLGKLESKVASKIMPINNFMLATEPLPESMARELIRDDVAVQDSLFVVNYWRMSGDNRLIFGGGENYSSRFPKDIKGFVKKCMLKIYPQLKSTKIDYGWGGTLAITLNRMPHFDRVTNNVYVAQGYSGHGVPTSIFAGKVVAEAIAGDASRFDVFSKIPTHTFPGGTLLRWPGLVLGMTYYALMDRM
jgi:gamma-glutamylputrescine oxidase